MPRYFVDTFYLAALSDPRDQWHARVLAFSRSLRDYHLYTVDEVLAEYLTFTARPDLTSGPTRSRPCSMCCMIRR